MKKSLKSLSMVQIQEAFSRALTELAGRECSVVVHELRFEHVVANEMRGTELVAFSGQLSTKQDFSDPFGKSEA